MTWFDTHAHIQDPKFDHDREQVIEKALAAGVEKILLPGADLESSIRAAEMSAARPELFCCSVGIHPHDASAADQSSMRIIRDLIRERDKYQIVAVGEVGLDYHYDFSPRPVQRQVFEQFIEMASEFALPLIIHNRESTADCLDILKAADNKRILRSVPGVFHCFSGSVETADRLLDLGFYLGFDGPITFKNAHKSAEVIRICPVSRLLLETDSPYLTPVPYRGRRNEPAYLPLVGEKMAEILGVSVDEAAHITRENARTLFGV